MFDPISVQAILSIPLPRRGGEDILFWGLTKNGVYSVRSGYWLGMLGDRIEARNDASMELDRVWKTIWNLNGPPKLKHFLWRACKHSLPVNEVRFHRHMSSSPLCTRCHIQVETLCHALIECPQAKAMWEGHPCAVTMSTVPLNSFLESFQWLQAHTSSEDLSIICISLWACWFGRNRFVMENKHCDLVQLSSSFVTMLREYLQYNQRVVERCIPATITTHNWRPPMEGWVKVNFDAHVGIEGHRGLGVAVRNHEGTLLLAAIRRIKSHMGTKESEATAAIFALEIASRFEFDQVHLEGDALNVTNAINRYNTGLAPIYHLYKSLEELSNCFHGFACSFVRRSGITVAPYDS